MVAHESDDSASRSVGLHRVCGDHRGEVQGEGGGGGGVGGEGRGQEQPAKLFTTKRGKFPISTLYDFLFHCLHGMLDFEIRIFLFSALKIEQYNFKSSPFDPHTCFFPLFFSGTGDIFTHSKNL